MDTPWRYALRGEPCGGDPAGTLLLLCNVIFVEHEPDRDNGGCDFVGTWRAVLLHVRHYKLALASDATSPCSAMGQAFLVGLTVCTRITHDPSEIPAARAFKTLERPLVDFDHRFGYSYSVSFHKCTLGNPASSMCEGSR